MVVALLLFGGVSGETRAQGVLGPDVRVTNGYLEIGAIAGNGADGRYTYFLSDTFDDEFDLSYQPFNSDYAASRAVAHSAWTLLRGTRSARVSGHMVGTATISTLMSAYPWYAGTWFVYTVNFELQTPQVLRFRSWGGCSYCSENCKIYGTDYSTPYEPNGPDVVLPTYSNYVLNCNFNQRMFFQDIGTLTSDANWGVEVMLTPVDTTGVQFESAQSLAWSSEGWTSWNVYRGDLATLRSTEEVSQDPGSTPAAARFCGLTIPALVDPYEPAPGEVVYWLVAGVSAEQEEDLGAGQIHPYPCPPAP
jgi:hypothetical protein